MRRKGLLAGLALALLTPALAEAQATGQGSALTSPANYPYHCETRWTLNGQQYEPIYIGPSTCSLYQIGAKGQVKTTHLVPGTGTVTKARIKSGPNPAPVSIATVRQFTGPAQGGGTQTTCCRGVSQTPVVNPTPNAITEIPVNFRVETKRYDPNKPNEAGYWDIVAVNVHGDTGTLPMSDLGGPKPVVAPDSDFGATWYFPKFDPSVDNQNAWFASGFEVLMNYDWCPAASAVQARMAVRQSCPSPSPSPTPTPTPTPGPSPTPSPGPGGGGTDAKKLVQITSSKLSLKGRATSIGVKCTATSACDLTVRLKTRGKKPALLASKKLRVKAGQRAAVKVTLSARSKRRVTRRGIGVRIEADLGSAGVVTRDVTLKRGK